jgi:prolipoprotein diacylglyceryltransferase
MNWYGLLQSMGFTAATLLLVAIAIKRQLGIVRSVAVWFGIVGLSLLGGRLGYALIYSGTGIINLSDPRDGFAITGMVLTGAAATAVLVRIAKLPMGAMADAVMLSFLSRSTQVL